MVENGGPEFREVLIHAYHLPPLRLSLKAARLSVLATGQSDTSNISLISGPITHTYGGSALITTLASLRSFPSGHYSGLAKSPTRP